MHNYRVHIGNLAVEFSFQAHVAQVVALNSIRTSLISAINSVSAFDESKIVATLIRNYSNVKPVSPATYGNYTNQMRLSYESWQYKLYVYDATGAKTIWNGAITYFTADKLAPQFSDYKGKTVRFTYAGGTVPNQVRVVKVETVDEGHIAGTDIVKNEHRKFLTNKISGLTEVK